MVKYCIYCGKQLEEGQICGCQQQDMPQMQNYPPVQQQVAYSPSVVSVVLNFLKHIIMRPFDAMDILLESNSYIPGGIVIALQVLLSSLFAIITINNAGWIFKLMNISGSVFFCTFIGAVLLDAIFLGGVVLCTLLSRQKVELVIALDVVALRSGIIAIFNVLAILFSFLGTFGFKASFLLFIISELFAIVLTAIVLSEKLRFNKTSLFYVFPIIFVIMFGTNAMIMNSYIANLQTKLITEDYAEKVEKYVKKHPEEAEKTLKNILGIFGKDEEDTLDDMFKDLF